MVNRYYPIGIQTFADIISRKAVYIDKTAYVYRLATEGKYYFLARPRRFGKSLMISTLEAYFKGKRELFSGLAIDSLEKDWLEYPVFRFDMSKAKHITEKMFNQTMHDLLEFHEIKFGIRESLDNTAWSSRLNRLIHTAYEQTGKKVVILVDEYDAPLLDTMMDKASFDSLRQRLRDFYSPLKSCDEYLQFVFLTGITKFSQLSIFSELNNLKIISMNDEYAAICGITEEELHTQLAPDIEIMAQAQKCSADDIKSQLKKRYDGYHFTKKCPDIYNPFSVLNAFDDRELNNYWFSTGTPTWLAESIHKYDIDPEKLEGFSATRELFDMPTETAVTPIPVLYQSGYLTIKKYDGFDYTLGFPNEEVRIGFLKCLWPFYININNMENQTFISTLCRAFRNDKLEDVMTLLRSFISSVPYNAEKQTENHYKTIFYLIFRLCSEYVVRTEECTAAGRSDVLVETNNTIYLFEFKLDGSPKDALAQIDTTGYLIPYQAGSKNLVKIGANFDSKTRTVGEWLAG